MNRSLSWFGLAGRKRSIRWIACAWMLALIPTFLSAKEPVGQFRVGIGRVCITPPVPFWLSGYAARTNPAPVVRNELWAKALAIEDSRGRRCVIVTTDLIGLPREVSDPVIERVRQRHGLDRSAVILNSSHTHAGPAIWPNLRVMFGFDDAEQKRVRDYSMGLVDQLAKIISEAIEDLAPATLEVGHGTCSFAINRREPGGQGVRIGYQPLGPTDHDVPVLRVRGQDGALRAVLFGYACHNTTVGGDFYQVDSDYAGKAQRVLEASHPGATALFVMLCGGDQNPRPRGTTDRIEQHGTELAGAVEWVLGGTMRPLSGQVRSAYAGAKLDFAPHTRETFVKESASPDVFRQRRARLMLEAYDRGEPIRHLEYPVQAVRVGNDFTVLAMGGEVVVDYGLRARRQYPAENLMVAGYCHDVACYIPSLRVLREGGYEAVDSMIYYGQPGPFAESVEDRVFDAVTRVMKSVGAGLPQRH